MTTLIIVDCQNDFITGSLAVQGAREAIDAIEHYINEEDPDKIIFTADWHPYNHCSFKRFGGQWPRHCVQHTPGACIDSHLLKCVESADIPYQMYLKGMFEEEYGAFNNIEKAHDSSLGDVWYFGDWPNQVVSADAESEFVICGIAGDYCVKATIDNLLKVGIKPRVLLNGIASIDDGTIIKDFINQNKLELC